MVGKIASQFVAPDEEETKTNYSSLAHVGKSASGFEHLTVKAGAAKFHIPP